MTHGAGPWPWWRWALTGMSTLALALSAYLGWHHLMGGAVIGCGGGNACDQVLSSQWSAIRGVVPVSGLAVGAYMALLLASFFIGPATAPPDRRLAWGAMLVLTGAAAGSAVWFTIVQKWVIGAFCPYCMATHITGVLLAALVFWRTLLPSKGAAAVSGIRRLPAVGLSVAGLALAGILGASQYGFAPPAVYRGGESQTRLPAMEARAVPLVGAPDAPYVVTLLFDYQCPHCQQIHAMLDEAVRRYDGKLAFVLCPAPLNSKCNPYVARDVDEFKDSCELARIALAVWVANREAFPAFDRWIFSPAPDAKLWHPRSLDDARAKAVEGVGQAKFDAALADPWIDRYLQISIQIYGDTIERGGNAVPKLVYGSRWVTPEPRDPDDLVLILQNSLGLPKP